MPGNLMHENATVSCPHAGQVTVVSANQNVKVSGMAVATVADLYSIAGCPFTVPGPKAQPCMTLTWAPARQVFVNGQPVVLSLSTGVCKSAEQVPQGPPTVSFVQTSVRGT